MSQQETRDPQDLTAHPKNDEIYADSAEDWFINNVEENGVLEPVVVTENSYFENGEVIISGHRRVDAAIKAGLDEVPVRFEEYETAAAELATLVDYNQQREKTYSQKMREALTLESVERTRAKGRQGTRTDLDQNFGKGDWGSTPEKVAKKVGFGNPETYRQARKVWTYYEEGYDWAEDLVKSLNEGDESIYGAFTEVKKMEERLQNQERVHWDELEEICLGSIPLVSTLESIFDKERSNVGERDWFSAAHFLYQEFADEHAVEHDTHAIHQVFLYLLETNGYVAFAGNLSDPESDEPLSLTARRPSADKLEELYWAEGQTTGEISLRYSVNTRLVRFWMYEHDIPIRRATLDSYQQEKLDNLRDIDDEEDEEETE